MNHAERKALKRAAKVQAVYSYTVEQLEQLRQEAFNKAYEQAQKEFQKQLEDAKRMAADRACQAVAVIPLVLLHDKCGFGKIRLQRFVGWMETWIKAINDDPETLKELTAIAENLTNFRFCP